MNEREIEIAGKLEFNDLFRNIIRQTLKKVWWFFSIGIIITLYVVINAIFELSAGKNLTTGILYPLFPLFIILLTLYGGYSSSKKLLRASDGNFRYLFGEDGYKVFSSIGNSEMSWQSLEEVKETTKDFLFFTQKPRFVVIPKRWFENEKQIVAFRELIASILRTKAKLKK